MILKLFTVLSLVTLSHADSFGATLVVNAVSDIYSAGHSSVPNTLYPGALAPLFAFMPEPNQVLSFSSVTGSVGCNFLITNGPDGSCLPGVDTTVTSYGGLSGITAIANNMFLVGVFLDSTEPAGSGPSTLVYGGVNPAGLTTSNPSFSPMLDQVFFIGDGLTGTGAGQQQQFFVPNTALRLYLGFADSFDSVPSYYDDNVGSVTANFQIGESIPEPGTWVTAAGALALVILVQMLKSR